MLYNPKDYRTNRHAVMDLRHKVLNEMITTKEAVEMGAKKSQLVKWVREEKLRTINFKNGNRYNKEDLMVLILESLK